MKDKNHLSNDDARTKKSSKLALITLTLLVVGLSLITIGGINIMKAGVAVEIVSKDNLQKLDTTTLTIEAGSPGLAISLDDQGKYQMDSECSDLFFDSMPAKKANKDEYEFDIDWKERLILTYWFPATQEQLNRSMDELFKGITSQCGTLIQKPQGESNEQ